MAGVFAGVGEKMDRTKVGAGELAARTKQARRQWSTRQKPPEAKPKASRVSEMDELTVLLMLGIVVGGATFFVAALRARSYVQGSRDPAARNGGISLRGMAWVILAACGALYAYTSIEAMARLNEKDAELTRRRTITASLDRKLRAHHDGLRKLQAAVHEVKGSPADIPPERLTERIERILSEVQHRERALR